MARPGHLLELNFDECRKALGGLLSGSPSVLVIGSAQSSDRA